ncbi:hypothetical protein [Anaeromyxobacter diazotrophicus]|uniref:IF-2 protein n=1 Tax=Anaeromyxobacter diazotrophicus TaxID=2590199 RepID=A0A7I9VQV8_9BACT|nr:hypothetical protein [Anaeromyxobacter diazotrophicus]GEJ58648.1 hypothetical protein AMYX_33890 [Anaeromyxobacter diazotrophicus]
MSAPARGSAGRTFLLVVAVLALFAVVVYLLSERNARTYTLALEDGYLTVKKGVMAPMGRQTFKTADPAQAQAYAPLKPPAGFKLDEERTFDDRGGLDQALYEYLAKWARDDLATEKPELVERALSWIDRAEKLAGLSATQREDLRTVRAESGYFEARQLLGKATDALRQAREKLKLTAASSSHHAGEAGEALRLVGPTVDELYRAERALASPGGNQPVPPAEAAPPAPAAQVQQPGPAPAR